MTDPHAAGGTGALRLVPTPLPAPIEPPDRRDGTLDPALEPAFVTGPGQEPPARRLREPGVRFVSTGQQPALFTGPLYTLYKALSAAALARVLERRWEQPVVPVFWVAGDDHDLAEAGHAEWVAGDGSVRSAALPPRPPDAPLTPLYRVPLGPEVAEALAALEADLPGSEFRDRTVDWLRRHFRPEATVAGSYAAALAELVAPLGVLVFDSTHPAVKRSAAPLFLRALAAAPELDRELDRRARELAAEGRDPGVPVGDGATLVMIECRLGRDRLVAAEGGFLTRRGKRRYDLAALESLAAREPERFSPNVLLRPVVEAALLPTVAYVAGPGELRYLPLTRPIYQHLGVRPQRAVPRWSGVLVEPRVDRVLAKFGIALEDLMTPPGELEARLVRSRVPESAADALAALREALETHYGTIGRAAVEIDPTLAQPVEGARRRALAGLEDVEKKLVQHLKKRAEIELGQIARARNSVWPLGRPQERVLTAAPFLARHGPRLLEDVLEAARTWYAETLEGAWDPA